MAEKRTKKAVEEAKEAKANEQLRRKSGKVPVCVMRPGEGADFRVSLRISDNYETRSRRRRV